MTAAQYVVLSLVRIYQAIISPWLGPRCRFYPSCSAYCAEAVQRFGAMRGLWFTGKRLLKCHPFHPGGVDLVPGAEEGMTIGSSRDKQHEEASVF